MMWLYIGKVHKKVEVNDIIKYIVSKSSDNDNNSSENQIDVLKLSDTSYRVGIVENIFQHAKSPEFWPQNIIVRRFNFNASKANSKAIQSNSGSANKQTTTK